MTETIELGTILEQLHDIRVQLQKILKRLRRLEEASGVEDESEKDE